MKCLTGLHMIACGVMQRNKDAVAKETFTWSTVINPVLRDPGYKGSRLAAS